MMEVDTTIGEDDRDVSFLSTKCSDCPRSSVHGNFDRHRGYGADISAEVKAVGHTDVGPTIFQTALVVNLAYMWTGGVSHDIAF